jgi:hypothetical protein
MAAPPPVYKPNGLASVQRAAAPGVYRPDPAAPVQRMAAPTHKLQGAGNTSPAAPSPIRRPATGIPSRSSAAQSVVQAKRAASGGGFVAPPLMSRSTTIQREIYKFEQENWVLKKLGTPGSYPLPARPDQGNVYFNNVTGKQGPSIKDVEAGLVDLMIVKGALKDLKADLQWPEDLWNGLQGGTDNGSVTSLGTIRLKVGKNFGGKGLMKWLTPLWSKLLGPFMERNGQLPYIKAQNWYTSGRMVVDISVNFYNNRSAEDATLGFHKDTSGDNLFVNLIFNNKLPILATEWVVDQRKMKAAKKRKMNKYMGSDEVADAINATRTSIVNLEYLPQGTNIIEGGVETGEAGFVSWVDELIWHSSPYARSRTKHGRTLNNLNPSRSQELSDIRNDKP